MTAYTGNEVGVGSDTYIGVKMHFYINLGYPYSNCANKVTSTTETNGQEVFKTLCRSLNLINHSFVGNFSLKNNLKVIKCDL